MEDNWALFRVRKNLSELLSTEEKTTVSRRSSGVSSFGGADLDKERQDLFMAKVTIYTPTHLANWPLRILTCLNTSSLTLNDPRPLRECPDLCG
jgi:hypothetical protein